MRFASFVSLLLLIAGAAQAKVFRNNYISFEMPDTWRCNLEQTEWVCRSESLKESKEAIIILTAKEVGPTDSFQQYEDRLNSSFQVTGRSGTPTPSKPSYKAKKIQINGQTWIDGLHLSSEVPNYFTRYMATIKEKIAVLITFSAHRNFYAKYSQDFFKSVQSLRVIASKNLLSRPDMGNLRPGTEMLGPGMHAGAMPADMTQVEDLNAKGKGKKKTLFLGLALVVGGVGAYFLLKGGKKTKRRR